MNINTSYAEIAIQIENLRKMRNNFAEKAKEMASYTEEEVGPTIYPIIQIYLKAARDQISEMDSDIKKAEEMLKETLELNDLAEKLSEDTGIDFDEF